MRTEALITHALGPPYSSIVSPSSGTSASGNGNPHLRTRLEEVVDRLQMNDDNDGDTRGDSPDLVGGHDERPTVVKARAAAVDDRDSRFVGRDRCFHVIAPDCVARDVRIAEDETTDGAQKPRRSPAAMFSRGPRDRQPAPVENGLDRACKKRQVVQPSFVLGLTENGNDPRQEARGGVVEVIAVQMRDDHGVEVAHNLIGWERKGDERVPARVRGIFDRRPGTDVVEHRVDENASTTDLQ
jgi:hypothetical protein